MCCKSVMRVGTPHIENEENITHAYTMEDHDTFEAGLLLPVVESITER